MLYEVITNDSRNIPWYKRLVAWREARRFARKTKRAIKSTLRNFGQEAMETREMAQLFFRLLDSKLELSKRSTPPSDEEVKAAVEQLIDVARISVFASISLLPGGGFSLIGLVITSYSIHYTKLYEYDVAIAHTPEEGTSCC